MGESATSFASSEIPSQNLVQSKKASKSHPYELGAKVCDGVMVVVQSKNVMPAWTLPDLDFNQEQ